jgi:hypothetical protein
MTGWIIGLVRWLRSMLCGEKDKNAAIIDVTDGELVASTNALAPLTDDDEPVQPVCPSAALARKSPSSSSSSSSSSDSGIVKVSTSPEDPAGIEYPPIRTTPAMASVAAEA